MTPTVIDFGKLLSDVPPGAWAAISHDGERVIAFAAEMSTAIEKAKQAGERDPVIIRVPRHSSALAL